MEALGHITLPSIHIDPCILPLLPFWASTLHTRTHTHSLAVHLTRYHAPYSTFSQNKNGFPKRTLKDSCQRSASRLSRKLIKPCDWIKKEPFKLYRFIQWNSSRLPQCDSTVHLSVPFAKQLKPKELQAISSPKNVRSLVGIRHRSKRTFLGLGFGMYW